MLSFPVVAILISIGLNDVPVIPSWEASDAVGTHKPFIGAASGLFQGFCSVLVACLSNHALGLII